MNKITLNAYAKINLTLDIVGKRQDGYHLIRSVMQSISLCDTLTVEKSEEMSLYCDRDDVPCDERNIVYKIAKAFFEYTDINGAVKVDIKKRIPSQAGLGGGSADGAAVLVGLDKLFNTNLSTQTLCQIGHTVGADIPFCIMGGTLLAEGIGEKLTPLTPLCDCTIVLAKPNFGIDTKVAYSTFDTLKETPDFCTDVLIKSLGGKVEDTAPKLNNMFEACLNSEKIEAVKLKLLAEGAKGACMSGSGSAVFAMFDNFARAKVACEEMQKHGYYSQIVTPVAKGVEILEEV